MNLRLLLFSLVLAFAWGTGAPHVAEAQELDCRVTVNYDNLDGSEFSFLNELEEKIEEYMNEESWTDDRFQDFERVSCSMEIFFQEAISLTEFRAQLVVGSRRPIYATTQQTPITRLRDTNWRFTYNKGQPLPHNLQRYDGLTSVLDFYAYVILGYDYDTFGELGGTPYFEEARQVADLAQANGASEWTPVGGQGRVTLITQLLDPRYRPLRRALFRYHFNALDRFVDETEAARESVLETLDELRALNQNVSRRYVLDLFFASKYEELAALFEESQLESRAYGLLSQLDAAHMSTYDRLQ